MFIGHLPAGYLATRTVFRDTPRAVMIAGLIGSVAPDLDMLWFHFVDHGGTHHHDYITHRPFVWAILLLAAVLWKRRAPIAFAMGAMLHMMLDTIVGKIAWGWPFSDYAVPLVVVPATQDHWVLSFLLHWTFMVEITLACFALWVA